MGTSMFRPDSDEAIDSAASGEHRLLPPSLFELPLTSRSARNDGTKIDDNSHHVARAQIRDRLGVIADRPQDLVGVRARLGRHAVELAAAMGQTKAAARKAQAAVGRFELLYRAARDDLRMIDHFLDLPDAGAGGASGIENFLPFTRAVFGERVLDDRAQCRLVLLPRKPVGKARIVEHVLAADRLHQRLILLLIVD